MSKQPISEPLRVAQATMDGLRRCGAVSSIAFDMQTYKTPNERAALRAGLGTAAGICDLILERIHRQHTKRGRLTKEGVALVELAQEIGNAIWSAREKVDVDGVVVPFRKK